MSQPEEVAESASRRVGSLPICEFWGCYIEDEEPRSARRLVSIASRRV